MGSRTEPGSDGIDPQGPDTNQPKPKFRKLFVVIAAILTLIVGGVLTACTDDDADVASENISKDADNFKIPRRIIFINTVAPDKPILVIEGYCSISDEGKQLEVTCKRSDGIIKNFLGLQSGHVTYLIEQLEAKDVSTDHYKRSFNPSVAIPDIELR